MGEGYIDLNALYNVASISSDDFLLDIHPNKMDKVEMHSASMSTTIRLTKWQMLMVTGMYKMVIDNCPDKKVVHLIKYGRKERIRHKNFNRAIKIICKNTKE